MAVLLGLATLTTVTSANPITMRSHGNRVAIKPVPVQSVGTVDI